MTAEHKILCTEPDSGQVTGPHSGQVTSPYSQPCQGRRLPVRGLGFRPERVGGIIDDEVQGMVLRRSRVAAVSVACNPGDQEVRAQRAYCTSTGTANITAQKSGIGPPPSWSPAGTLLQLCRDGRRRGRVDGRVTEWEREERWGRRGRGPRRRGRGRTEDTPANTIRGLTRAGKQLPPCCFECRHNI